MLCPFRYRKRTKVLLQTLLTLAMELIWSPSNTVIHEEGISQGASLPCSCDFLSI